MIGFVFLELYIYVFILCNIFRMFNWYVFKEKVMEFNKIVFVERKFV